MNCIGRKKNEIETPALCLAIDKVQRNLVSMAEFFKPLPSGLRPHFKTHKTPLLARMQVEAGAVGITCAKLGEAEVLGQAGIRDILIANQIVGADKIRRLVNLAAYTDVMVAVDEAENLRQLAAAAQEKHVVLRVLIEYDVGMGRCGVRTPEAALTLTRLIAELPALRFEGIMGYEGHAVMIPDYAQRQEVVATAMRSLVGLRDHLQKQGFAVPIVSAGGTGSYTITGCFEGVTEIQAGSYLTMDAQYRDKVGIDEFECALTMLTRVIHTHDRIAVVDAGLKCCTTEFGMPMVASCAGWRVSKLSEEHGFLEREGGEELKMGDTVELIPSHGCTTINLHDVYHVTRDNVVEAVWPIAARGRCT